METNNINILVVENNKLTAEHIKNILYLNDFGSISIFHNKKDAIEKINLIQPNIAIINIDLVEKNDGIEIGKYIFQNFKLPIIYLTNYKEQDTIQKAIKTYPSGFILSPFEDIDILISIKLAIEKYNKNIQEETILIEFGNSKIEISQNDILFLKYNYKYLEIHTKDNKYLVKTSLKKFLSKIDSNNFKKINKNYAINKNHINKYTQ